MAFSKAASFDDGTYMLSLLCRACSHPARLVMLRRLVESQDYIPHHDLTSDIPLSGSTISQHLRTLRQLDLITSRNAGVSNSEHRLSRRSMLKVDLLQQIVTMGTDRHWVNST